MVGKKFFIAYASILIFSALIAFLGIRIGLKDSDIKSFNENFQMINQTKIISSELSKDMYSYLLYTPEKEGYFNEIKKIKTEIDEKFTLLLQNLDKLKITYPKYEDKISTLLLQLEKYKKSVENLYNFMLLKEREFYANDILTNNEILEVNTNNLLDEIYNNAISELTNFQVKEKKEQEESIAQMIIIMTFLILSLFYLFKLYKSEYKKPVKKIKKMLDMLLNGEFSYININQNNEIGELAESLNLLSQKINNMFSDIISVCEKINLEGDIDCRIDTKNISGIYENLCTSVNNSFDLILNDTKEILAGMDRLAEGNFEYALKTNIGKKRIYNIKYENLKCNLVEIRNSILQSLREILVANFEYISKEKIFKNGWGEIENSLYEIILSGKNFNEEITKSMEEFSNGNLETRICGNFKCGYSHIQNAANNAMNSVTRNIAEIKYLINGLSSISDKTDFLDLKELLQDVNETVKQIFGFSNKFSDIIFDYSAGALDIQMESSANTVQILSRLNDAREQIKELTEISINPNEAIYAVEQIRKFVKIGIYEIYSVKESIDKISKHTVGISDLLNNIEDISNQTSLLALNSSVEAARAGEKGKPFVILAEEIESLALKTKKSLSEIENIIFDSVQISRSGDEIAEQILIIFNEIANRTEFFTNYTGEISGVSNKIQKENNLILKNICDIIILSEKNKTLLNKGNEYISWINEDSLTYKSEIFNFFRIGEEEKIG